MMFWIIYIVATVLSFNRYFYYFVILLLSILGGLNSNIEDFFSYYYIYNNVPYLLDIINNGYGSLKKLYGEDGYLILNSIVKMIFDNYYFFRVIVLFLSFSIIFYVFKKTSYFLSITVAYFIVNFYYTDTIILRTTLASAFILLSLYNIENNRFIIAFFNIIIAIFFHVSSLGIVMILLIYFLLPFNRVILLLLLFLAFIISNIGLVHIISYIMNHLFPYFYITLKINDNIAGGLYHSVGIFRGTVILNLLIILYFIIKINTFKRFKYFKIFFLSYFVSFIFLITLNDISIFGDRLFFIYSLPISVLLSYILKFIKPKSFVLIFILLLISILFLQKLLYVKEYVFIGYLL